MEPEPSHAATMVSACSVLGALGRHAEALAMAQRAVDLLTKDPRWAAQVGRPTALTNGRIVAMRASGANSSKTERIAAHRRSARAAKQGGRQGGGWQRGGGRALALPAHAPDSGAAPAAD